MENSILISTKKILGIGVDYTAFDLDLIIHINSTLSIINQMGIGPTPIVFIEDEELEWSDLSIPDDQLGLLKAYVYLRVRMLFDPPISGFLISAVNQQIEEFETRLHYMREATIPVPVPTIDEEVSEWSELFALDWGAQGADQG